MSKTLIERYESAKPFPKPTVLALRRPKTRDWQWAVVGPGFPWLGKKCSSWQEAINAALDKAAR